MTHSHNQAFAEKGLGFLSLRAEGPLIKWDPEMQRRLGPKAEAEAEALAARLRSPLRTSVLKGIASTPGERVRCVVPLEGQVMELVLLPSEEDGCRQGYFFPYPLHEPMEMMKKYFLSNISNKLRSLLNSVIIASDVVTSSGEDQIREHRKFLSLMAEDAREVNTLLNRLGEIINYSSHAALGDRENVEIGPLLSSVHANLNYLAQDASIGMGLALPEHCPRVSCNPTLLLLVFFLTLQYALSNTDPLGEIIISACDGEPWTVDVSFSGTEVPANVAVNPEKHGLVEVSLKGWSDAAPLQLIDSLLGLHGLELAALHNGRGLGLLRLPLPSAC